LDSRSRAADLLALVPAAAIPLVFLHARYQPEVTVGSVNVFASDVAVAIVVASAIAAGCCFGWRPLYPAWPLWLASAALLALFAVSCFWRPLENTTTHLITAAKIGEYALLAPAVVLLFRRRAQMDRFILAFVAWGVAASGWAVLQFMGVINEFEGRRPGQLEPSFLGNVDFAVISGGVLAVGFAGIVLRTHIRVDYAAVVAGAIGAIIAAQVLPYFGIVLMAAACLFVAARSNQLTRRRAFAVVAVTAVVGVGVLALRSYDTANFLRFLGIKPASKTASATVQTGSQRTMLAYIGLRIWLDHPLLGVGFERSGNRYQPYLAAAKRKFPQAAYAFPSKQHQWGVQNLWVQLLADTGVVGFVLGVATFVIALGLALRGPPRASAIVLIALGWILVCIGAWTGMGIVAGIPLQALTWLGFGLAAVARDLE
jgi:O-Antigen ligase